MDASNAVAGPVNSQEGDNLLQLFPNVVLEGVDQLTDRLVDLNKSPLNSSEVPAAPLAPVMQDGPGSSQQAFIFGANRTISLPSVNAASDDGHSGCYEATSSRRALKAPGHVPGLACKRAAEMKRDLKRLKRENKLLKKELEEARAEADSTGDDDDDESTFRLPVFTNQKRHDRYMPTITKELRRTVRECLRTFAEEEASASAKKRRQRALRNAAEDVQPVEPAEEVSSQNADNKDNVEGAGPSAVAKGKEKCEEDEAGHEDDQQEELDDDQTSESDSHVLSVDVFTSDEEIEDLEADFADDESDATTEM